MTILKLPNTKKQAPASVSASTAKRGVSDRWGKKLKGDKGRMREVMERKTDEIRAPPKTKIKQTTPCLISHSLYACLE